MWRAHLLLGLRSLARHRAYGILNISGLALGLAACLTILVYVRYETQLRRLAARRRPRLPAPAMDHRQRRSERRARAASR